MNDLDEQTRLSYAADSLAGLSVGDALGAQYFMVGRRPADLLAGILPPPVWEWTDDTEMACSVTWMLREAGGIDPDRLAAAFAERCEPNRGYGAGALTTLRLIRRGMPWADAAGNAFNGEGSCGNGAAMRVAPLGAYFADDPARAASEAEKSAIVTHAHPEGVAGAVAVAVAASIAAAGRAGAHLPAGPFIDAVGEFTPAGIVGKHLAKARQMLHVGVSEAAYVLGNGSNVTAQDTVAFTIWVAAKFRTDYPAAIRACVEAGGDVDTTAAIVGGIVASYTGVDEIPPAWLTAREPLPTWA
jgi:ADP-ribosylglycohydrolase